MGLFSKNPTSKEQAEISQNIFWVQSFYKTLHDGCGVEVFADSKQRVFSSLNLLIKYEKKYPSFFKHPTPTENYNKVLKELPKVEKKFVDYTVVYIEKKLLNYSTDRGKRNNFNKETDKFRYYAGEFLPETVDYFTKMIQERFPEYL